MVIGKRGLYTQIGLLSAFLFFFSVLLASIVVLRLFGGAVGGNAIAVSSVTNSTVMYMEGALGTAGMASWLPVFIVVPIVLIIIASLAFRKGL